MMATKLLKMIPPHKVYVEVFGGGASLLFAKHPATLEVYNDLDSSLVGFFRVLRDEKKFLKLHRLILLTPYSREEYYAALDSWKSYKNDVERAYKWYVVARMSFSGLFGKGWGFVVRSPRRWLSVIEKLPQIHARLMRVQIEHLDFRKLIPLYDGRDTFFYLDPPYAHETRKGGIEYAHEMTLKDHQELVKILLSIKGRAVLSGYKHSVYAPLESAGWRCLSFKTFCHAVMPQKIQGRGQLLGKPRRTEVVWLSPSKFWKGK